MNLNSASLKNLQPVINGVKRYRFMLFLLLFTAMYAYLFITINQLTNANPTAADINNETQATVKRLRVDEEAVQNMLRLEEESIEVQGLFEEARNNPFSE